ncbi:MAG: hypothetical protein R2911_35350 [Caldilineaceae bacterium]
MAGAAYVVSAYDAEADEDRAHIWLADLESGQARQMTSGATATTIRNGRWGRSDGQTLAFGFHPRRKTTNIPAACGWRRGARADQFAARGRYGSGLVAHGSKSLYCWTARR